MDGMQNINKPHTQAIMPAYFLRLERWKYFLGKRVFLREGDKSTRGMTGSKRVWRYRNFA